MPATDFYRAMATVKFLQRELAHERDAHNAMKLCFEKIHKSLDMYQGHYINRLRFHLNRHHTEYLRKVRAMQRGGKGGSDGGGRGSGGSSHDDSNRDGSSNTRGATAAPEEAQQRQRRSMRVGVAQDLANEVERLKKVVMRKELEIERLAMLLDEANAPGGGPLGRSAEEAGEVREVKEEAPRPRSTRKMMNPYYPTDDEDEEDDNDDAERVILISCNDEGSQEEEAE